MDNRTETSTWVSDPTLKFVNVPTSRSSFVIGDVIMVLIRRINSWLSNPHREYINDHMI
jgi:hypothetical protein